MPEKSLESRIRTAFSLNENIVSDEFISHNTSVLWLKEEVDYMVYVPSYMLWCLKNKDDEGSLVFNDTISALAEFGRSKNPQIIHLNFKFLCDDRQKKLVCQFLKWCRSDLLLIYEEQLDRAIKSWELCLNQ
jgi:hypothetical protein